MLLSMTGFGQHSGKINDKKFTIEIRSLNGKTSDIRLKAPPVLKEKELLLRKQISKGAIRGKLDATISIESEQGDAEFDLNLPLVKKYSQDLLVLQDQLRLNQSDILQSVMRIPNVISMNQNALPDEEWGIIESITAEALIKLNNFREVEGNSIAIDFEERVVNIQKALADVAPFEKDRIEKLKERMNSKLEDFIQTDQVDRNRFEQEVIYYIEKLDINEEKVRLAQHCIHFLEELKSTKKEKGKKLGFIGQEMGREINTMGAKAQHSSIQKLVVSMKDELEKIKEQVLNVV